MQQEGPSSHASWKRITRTMAPVSQYLWYPGDDVDVEFKYTVIKSSLLAFWKTLNFANLPTNKKVTSRFDTVVCFCQYLS